jgi:hypothetical protein
MSGEAACAKFINMRALSQPVMKSTLPALLLLVLSATVGKAQQNDFVKIAPEPRVYTWWLRTEFHPFETEVRGIPVGKIKPTWCRATEFRKSLFPPEARPDLDRAAGYGLAFSADGPFDHSKIRQTALIGAYEACSGERGSFLLIVAYLQSGPTVRFVYEMPDDKFGMLAILPRMTIQVVQCLECDLTTKFRWDSSRKQFRQLPPAPGSDESG